MIGAVLWAPLLAAALAAETFDCPKNETTGLFKDPDSCDVYWSCFQGEVTKELCDDGLGFDPGRVRLDEPCHYLAEVDCTGRDAVRPPQGTGVCERHNGVYPHENPNVCGKYYNCRNNVPLEMTCPPGLHFRLDTRTCDWPEPANRGACDSKRTLGDFSCDPSVEYFTAAKQKIQHPKFPHPEDCRKFYICKNGIDPTIASCDYGEVYNIDKAKCDSPLNVFECEDYYEEEEAV